MLRVQEHILEPVCSGMFSTIMNKRREFKSFIFKKTNLLVQSNTSWYPEMAHKLIIYSNTILSEPSWTVGMALWMKYVLVLQV